MLIHHFSAAFKSQAGLSGPLWISSLVRHRVGLMGERFRGTGRGWAEVLWAASKGSRVVAVTADWLMKSVTTQSHHVVITAVTEMGQLCCRRLPPGPWSGPTLGPGSGSGLWSQRKVAPAPRLLQTDPTEARTTRPDTRSRWIHPAVFSGGETSSAAERQNNEGVTVWWSNLSESQVTEITDGQNWSHSP